MAAKMIESRKINEETIDDCLSVGVKENEYSDNENFNETASMTSCSSLRSRSNYELDNLCEVFNDFFGEKLSKFVHIKDAYRKFAKKFKEQQFKFSDLESELICNDVELNVIEKIKNLHKLSNPTEHKPVRNIEKKTFNWDLQNLGFIKLYDGNDTTKACIFRDNEKRHFIEILKSRIEEFKPLLATFVSGNFIDNEAVGIFTIFSHKRLTNEFFNCLKSNKWQSDFDHVNIKLFCFEPCRQYGDRFLLSLSPVYGKPYNEKIFANLKNEKC